MAGRKKSQDGSKKKTWACKKGCSLAAGPCKHLERLLLGPNTSKPNFEAVNKYAGRQVDKSILLFEGEKTLLRQKLQEIDLEPIVINILILKYTYDESFEGISKELKIHNVETVKRLHDQAIEELKGKWY